MAAEPSLQDYVYAMELAYEDSPQGKIGAMPGYQLLAKPSLGDGFQAIILKAKTDGQILIAFRGTLPDLKGTVDRALAVYGDTLALSDSYPSESQYAQLAADQSALKHSPLVQDIITDMDLFNAQPTRQIADAISLVQNYIPQSPGGQIYLTGHSLGGGLVEAVADAIPQVSGVTFAAPGDKKFVPSNARLTNYINRNDPVGMVNLAYHVGKPSFLDNLHTSFDIESELSLPDLKMFGFNAVPDPDTALTLNGKRAASIIVASLGFLLARLAVYHPKENYAALVNRKSLGAGTVGKPASLRDLANVARPFIAVALAAMTGQPGAAVLPYAAPVVVPFTVRTVKAGGRVLWKIITVYGQAEMDAAQFGFVGAP